MSVHSFYHVYEGFVVWFWEARPLLFFMGAKRCLSQFETRDLVEYPFGFFDLCDIPQKPSPEASTQASLRDTCSKLLHLSIAWADSTQHIGAVHLAFHSTNFRFC